MILRRIGILVSLVLLVASGCAHYGYANRADVHVSVETIAVEGDSGLDPAALTRTMVGRLREQGVQASWAGTEETVASCSVRVVSDGASGEAWSPRVRATCVVSDSTFEELGNAGSSLGTPSNASIRDIQNVAATDAIVRIADAIAADVVGTGESDGQEQ